MTDAQGRISGEHRVMLYMEALHAGVVIIIIGCATLLTALRPDVISSDLLSFVYGGGITYAGGRAVSVRGSLSRRSDYPPNGDPDPHTMTH